MFEATPLAPLADGPEATAARTASGGFDEFWKSYPRKHGKTKAAAAYAKLNATPELHALIMTAVCEWSAHYAEHGTDKKWIPEPANWLDNERWDEDLPIIHGDAKGAAITKAKANSLPKPANDNMPADVESEDDFVEEPYDMVNDVSPFCYAGTYTGEVVALTRDGVGDANWHLELEFKNESHHTSDVHHFWVEHAHPGIAARGREFVQQIIDAIGIQVTPDTDTDEILFREMQITIDEKRAISYGSLPSARLGAA